MNSIIIPIEGNNESNLSCSVRNMKQSNLLSLIIIIFSCYNGFCQEFSFDQGGAASKDYFEVIPYEVSATSMLSIKKIFTELKASIIHKQIVK